MNKSDLKQLVEQAQGGNEESFSQIYDLYYERIAKYAFRRVLDYDAAQDVASNVFVKLINALGRFKWQHENSFDGWIFRIASNEVNQYLRGTMKVRQMTEEEEKSYVDSNQESVHEKVEKELDSSKDFVEINSHIAKLKPKNQELIHLYYFEQMSHKQMADVLKMKEGAVRTALHRALKELQASLSKNPNFKNLTVAQERS